jgi:hypothetical protein
VPDHSEEPHSAQPDLWDVDGTEVDLNATYKFGGQLWYLKERANDAAKAGRPIPGRKMQPPSPGPAQTPADRSRGEEGGAEVDPENPAPRWSTTEGRPGSPRSASYMLSSLPSALIEEGAAQEGEVESSMLSSALWPRTLLAEYIQLLGDLQDNANEYEQLQQLATEVLVSMGDGCRGQ